MLPLEIVSVAVFGAIIGSFLNAVLWRLHAGESVARGRSRCTSCRATLGAADLVPIISYLLLHGRCRHCNADIGRHYPLVELTTALLFVLCWWSVIGTGMPLAGHALVALLLRWYLAATFVVVFVYDLRHMLILRRVTLPATVIAIAANLALGVSVFSLALGMLAGWGFFRLQILVSRGRWVGGGDAWLGLLMGAALGWPMILVALFVAYVSGAAVGVALLALKRARFGSEIPFGTFLSAASVLTLLAGDRMLAWYLSLLA